MLNKIIGDKLLNRIYLFLYILLAVFLPLNKVGLSLTTLLLVLFTISCTPFPLLKHTFFQKRNMVWLSLFFSWMVLSLIWSGNKQEGLKFINLILPFFIVFYSLLLHPVSSRQHLNLVLKIFLWTVSATAACNLLIFSKNCYGINCEMRDLSFFVSHIRFALMVVIAMVLSFYFFIKTDIRRKWLFLLNSFFLLYYTFFSEVLSGFVSLIIAVIFLLFYFVQKHFKNRKAVRNLSLIICLIIASGAIVFLKQISEKPTVILLEKSKKGNLYWHDTAAIMFDNGYPISVNIQFQELNESWRKISNLPLDSISKNGMSYEWNLIRYLTSKGLTKDAEGVEALTKQDIENIEDGYVSVLDTEKGLRMRILKMKDEITNIDVNPNGNTLLQRINYCKAGYAIFKEHFWAGVGVGDVKSAYNEYYDKTGSRLSKENRRKSHQQFLSVGVSFGMIGLFVFGMFLWSSYKTIPNSKMMFAILTILICSFLNEDTLETQAGATLVAFFFGLFSGIRFHGTNEEKRLDEEE